MKGFLQVLSLFGVPLAIVIWYDLLTNTEAYQFTFNFRASRPVALGIHLVTAFLCLHLPLRLWRRFDATSLRLFCLSGSLVMFWVVVRLVSSGRMEKVPALHTILIFLVPIAAYPILRYSLFKLASPEFDGAVADSSSDTQVPGSEVEPGERDPYHPPQSNSAATPESEGKPEIDDSTNA